MVHGQDSKSSTGQSAAASRAHPNAPAASQAATAPGGTQPSAGGANQQQRGQAPGSSQPQQAVQNQQYHFDPDMIGAIKIKDGLFIGDELASQDIEFVVANKVTHIINCAGKQIPNHWEPIGVAYLTFFWLDQDNQVVLDPKDEASNAIFEFIEEAVEQTESVLVHSVRGQSRATCTLAAYIMRKYRWSLLKSLEFLNSRRPDLEIRATFIHQLSAYEQRLQHKFNANKFTSKWDELSDERPYITSEELILRNTFINAQMGPLADFRVPKGHTKQQTLKWVDETDRVKQGKDGLRVNSFDDDLLKKKELTKIKIHYEKSKDDVKNSLRPRNFTMSQITGVKNYEQINLHANPPPKQEEKRTASHRSNESQPKKKAPEPATKAKQARKETKTGSRATATPEMFYKKGDDDEEDEHIMSGIEVDEDEGESEVDDTRLLEEEAKKGRPKNRSRDSSTRQLPPKASEKADSKRGKQASKSKAKDQILVLSEDDSPKPKESGAPEEGQPLVKRSNNFVTAKAEASAGDTKEQVQTMHTGSPARGGNSGGQSYSQKGHNITNIINNNNINNFIINDPKAVAGLMQGAGVVQPSEERSGAQSSANQTAQQPTRPARPTRGASTTNPRSGQFESLNDANEDKAENEGRGPSQKGSKFGTDLIARRLNSQTPESRGLQNKNNVHALYNQGGQKADAKQSTGASLQPAQDSLQAAPTATQKTSKSPKIRNGVIVLNRNGVQYTQGSSSSGGARRVVGGQSRPSVDQQADTKSGEGAIKIPSKGAGHHRSISLQHKRASHGNNIASGSLHDDGPSQIVGHTYNSDAQNNSRKVNFHQTQQFFSGGGKSSHQRGGTAPPPQDSGFSGQPKTMANVIQKEMAKRHESPRSRRQIVGQFGPGGQQQAQGGIQVAAGVWNQRFNQTLNFHSNNDSLTNHGGVPMVPHGGIGGNVGVLNTQHDLNQYYINEGKQANSTKIGNYQYRAQQSNQIKNNRMNQSANSQGNPQYGRKMIEIGGNGNPTQAFQGHASTPANQIMMNRTGPIKIQNRLKTNGGSKSLGNDSTGYGPQKSSGAQGANKFNDSLNISDTQGSIQIMGPNQKAAMQGKFGAQGKQPTKIKRQLNIQHGTGSQGPIIGINNIPHNNLAWNAHRNSSVKPKQHQIRGNQGTGSESNINKVAQKDGYQGQTMRPGTAPKQALMNNFAVNQQNYGPHGFSTAQSGARGNERPLSPYSKVYSQQNQLHYNGQAQPRKRASSKRGSQHQQPQAQIISPNAQKVGHQAWTNNRRSQSPANNVMGNRM